MTRRRKPNRERTQNNSKNNGDGVGMARGNNVERGQRQAKRVKKDHKTRQLLGEQQLAEDRRKKEFDRDWNLGWFQPTGKQLDIIDSFDDNIFTVVSAASGCGKTSTALWKALNELKAGNYRQVIFIKNPAEVGDDRIGFLSGSETDKLLAHYETTKYIFHDFISPEKLENDIRNKKIRLTIPNFVLGATFDYSIVILDECQVMSPSTMKLLLERCGTNTKYFILGDNQQRYAISKRSDGFSDLINRIAVGNEVIYSNFGLIEMTADDNMRSIGSKLALKVYEGS